jgi:hypothetical protein
MTVRYPRMTPSRLIGSEQFLNADCAGTVLDFWRWAYSNLADNVTRGPLAEYLVASALGINEGVRSAWDAHDLRTPSGLTIEVKCAAYLQAWGHNDLSQIRFDISATREWDADTNAMAATPARRSHLYVLCLLKHQEKATLNLLNLSQWEFYVVPTTLLNDKCSSLKSISLARLKALDVNSIMFGDLRAAVEAVSAAT